MSKFYNALIRLVRFALPDMETVWEEPFDGEAAVFCPNHAASFGPIAMCAFFSLRDQCHPWLNAGIMERKRFPPMSGRTTGGSRAAFSSRCSI